MATVQTRFAALLFTVALIVGLVRSGGRQPSMSLAETELDTSQPLGPSALEMAAQYVYLDISYMRWLWWPVILYLFWGMAYVCDEYFVRTIDVISERFQIPDDVAGATLMALGCNGPEMALNTIAIFHPSNIGVGAVVGGEVFNVLVIIGTAVLATPDEYLPLQLRPFSFFRDVIFYVVSVGLLFWVLQDGAVDRAESTVLLLGAVCYTTTVVFSSQLSNLLSHVRPRRLARSATRRLTRTLTHKSSLVTALSEDFPDSDSDSESQDTEMAAQWSRSRDCADPREGSVLSVRVDVRNRLMDRNHRMEERYVWLHEGALLVSTAVDPTEDSRVLQRAETGKTLGKDHKWHHGGLVNQPTFLTPSGFEAPSRPLEQAFSATPMSQLSAPSQSLSDASKRKLPTPPAGELPEALRLPGFQEAPWELIPLEDVLYCQSAGDERSFHLHVHRHDSDLGSLITLEFSAKERAVLEAWVSNLCTALKEQRRGPAQAPEQKGLGAMAMEWAEWLQFPVKFALRLTIPNMDDPAMQHWYPVAFVMSMVWLAVFAFSVTTACDGIHADFGISVTVLGFTVAAAGTSFPNVFSGMVVARQGKTSMAVANALGANVQNVFLALAVPWAVQTWLIAGGPFPLVVHNLLPAVVECMVTLLPVVLVYLVYASSLPRWSGALFLATYGVYLVIALGQQSSGCMAWPFPCAAA